MTRNRSVAFVTCSDLPDLQPDDALAAARLSNLGIALEAAVWSDPETAWDGFDAIVLRSTWDYHLRAPEFLSWLDSRERGRAAVWNPPAVVRWNADKHYLSDLSEAGVAVVPTISLERGSDVDLRRLLDEKKWPRAVVKPAVSGGAYKTWIVDPAEPGDSEERLAELLQAADVLVQPFLSEIQTHGEWSLVFFDEAFSHAVVKHPAPGDFRVQEEFGGVAEAASAPDAIVAAARRALAVSPGPTLYARVDGCIVGGTFQLLELELIEPSLFLDRADGAASRFAAAIARRLL